MLHVYETTFIDEEGHNQGNQLWAHSRAEADALVVKRGLGERVLGYSTWTPTLPSEWVKKHKYAEAIHSVVWMAGVAGKSGVSTLYDMTKEGGILHDLAHLNDPSVKNQSPFLVSKTYNRVLRNLEAWEPTVPGYDRHEHGPRTKDHYATPAGHVEAMALADPLYQADAHQQDAYPFNREADNQTEFDLFLKLLSGKLSSLDRTFAERGGDFLTADADRFLQREGDDA